MKTLINLKMKKKKNGRMPHNLNDNGFKIE